MIVVPLRNLSSTRLGHSEQWYRYESQHRQKCEGFFSPIDNNFLNIAKAGQAIPAKWRLTDANGVPIGDPASFVGLFPIRSIVPTSRCSDRRDRGGSVWQQRAAVQRRRLPTSS
jgi:hypothetical protein